LVVIHNGPLCSLFQIDVQEEVVFLCGCFACFLKPGDGDFGCMNQLLLIFGYFTPPTPIVTVERLLPTTGELNIPSSEYRLKREPSL
jgi:hypothetical protein